MLALLGVVRKAVILPRVFQTTNKLLQNETPLIFLCPFALSTTTLVATIDYPRRAYDLSSQPTVDTRLFASLCIRRTV